MPEISINTPETVDSIQRPVIMAVTRQLLKALGMPANVPILYPGNTEETFQPGSAIDQAGIGAGVGIAGVNNQPFYERVTIEAEENYSDERMLSTAVYRAENRFIFEDRALQIYMKPIYFHTDVTINFKFRAVDRTQAIRWRDEFKMKVALLRDLFEHDVSYAYQMPPGCLVILRELHRLRELTEGYGDTYDQYFANHRTKRIDTVSNQDGSQYNWAVSETQGRVQGYFDLQGTLEQGAKEGAAEAWTISVAYKFSYDKPVRVVMEYPLMIHNTPVSQEYRPNDPQVKELEQNKMNFPLSAEAFRYFEGGKSHLGVSPGIAIPDYDEFIPELVLPQTMRVFNAMVTLDINNPTLLFNLQELGSIELVPAIRNFLYTEYPYVGQDYQSAICLSCFRSTKLMTSGTLKLDAQLNVLSNLPLSFRDMHHVRLGLVINLNLLTPAAKLRLRQNGLACNLILQAVAPKLAKLGLLPEILPNNYVGKNAFQAAVDYITKHVIYTGRQLAPQLGPSAKTTEILYIQTYRETNAAHH